MELYLDSADAKYYPEFNADISNSLKWFKGASQVWQRKTAEESNWGYCDVSSLIEAHPHTDPSYYLDRNDQGLCTSYPELVRSIGNVYDGYAPGFYFTVAEWDCWKRAKFDLRNAQHLQRGEAIEKLRVAEVRTNDEDAFAEIARESTIALGAAK